MKTSILRTVCFAFIVVLMNGFVSKAQESLYDVKMENGKVVSKTRFVPGDFGMRVKESESRYTYNENGDLLKKETFVWTPTYAKNNQGRFYADYSANNWTPQSCIVYKKNSVSNFASVEFLVWNAEAKAYGLPVKTMIYHLNDSNVYNYLAFQSGNEYKEVVNTLNYDKTSLAELVK